MISRDSKVIVHNLEKGVYQKKKFKDKKPGEMIVCTEEHFVHAVCKLFESTFGFIGDNPMYQKIDWSTAIHNDIPEVTNED